LKDLIVPFPEDLSPLLRADNSGATVRESSTPIDEAASSKTNIGLQPEDSENPEDATTRDCSVQYETFVSPLGGKNLLVISVWLFIFGFPRPYTLYWLCPLHRSTK
jgi:hypothetical protein